MDYFDGSYQGGTYQTADGRSPYGVYDLAGNADEWVSDWWNDHYYETEPPEGWIDPQGPGTGEHKILKGGTWSTTEIGGCRNSFRRGLWPIVSVPPLWSELKVVGFRCVREAD